MACSFDIPQLRRDALNLLARFSLLNPEDSLPVEAIRRAYVKETAGFPRRKFVVDFFPEVTPSGTDEKIPSRGLIQHEFLVDTLKEITRRRDKGVKLEGVLSLETYKGCEYHEHGLEKPDIIVWEDGEDKL